MANGGNVLLWVMVVGIVIGWIALIGFSWYALVVAAAFTLAAPATRRR